MILFDEIADRILPMRPDIEDRQAQLGFQVAVRRLAVDTYALQETVTLEVLAGTTRAEVYGQDEDYDQDEDYGQQIEKNCVCILKGEARKLGSTADFDGLEPLNEGDYRQHSFSVTQDVGPIIAYIDDGGAFVPYFTPEEHHEVRLLVAYAPKGGDFDFAPLNAECEDAIVAGTLAYILRLPGKHQNLQLAENEDAKFNDYAADVRSRILIGIHGYRRASSSNVVPRRNAWNKLR